MSKKVLASVARFAHLLGINPKAEDSDGEEDPKKQRDDETDEDYAKRMEEEDEKDKAKKAEDDDPDADADADDKGEAGDDEEKGKDKAARKAERARCASIFGSKAAATRPDMAAHLAFETDMSASAAVNMLGAIAAGQPKPSGLSSRMASVVVPVVGADTGAAGPDPKSAAGIAAKIIAAGKKARGETA